jgi:hypothetical protein
MPAVLQASATFQYRRAGSSTGNPFKNLVNAPAPGAEWSGACVRGDPDVALDLLATILGGDAVATIRAARIVPALPQLVIRGAPRRDGNGAGSPCHARVVRSGAALSPLAGTSTDIVALCARRLHSCVPRCDGRGVGAMVTSRRCLFRPKAPRDPAAVLKRLQRWRWTGARSSFPIRPDFSRVQMTFRGLG